MPRHDRSSARLRAPLIATVLLVLAQLGAPVLAQATPAPTIDELQTLLDGAERSSADDREEVAETYRKAIAALERAAEARARATAFAQDAADAPTLLDALRNELALEIEEIDVIELNELALEELEERHQQAQADLGTARGRVEQLASLAEYRSTRKAELPEAISKAQASIATATDALAAIGTSDADRPRRLLLRAQLDELREVLAALETERDTYEARQDLLPLRRDRANRALAIAQRRTDVLKGLVAERRTQEGEVAAREAEAQLGEITREFPELLEVAARNTSLAALRSGENGTPRRIARAEEALDAERGVLDEIHRRSRAARRRIAAGGLTEGMAVILRRDFEWITNESALRRTLEVRDQLLSDAQLEMIAFEEERIALGDVASATESLLARLGIEEPGEALREAARELVSAQRDALDALLDDLSDLTATFYAHQDVSRQLMVAARTYLDYIEKRILWVRSTAKNPLGSLRVLSSAPSELVERVVEQSDAGAVLDAFRRRWVECLALALVVLVLLLGRPVLLRRRGEMGTRVRAYKTDRYTHTVRALLHTLLLALPGPLFLGSVGWLLASSGDELFVAAGRAIREVALAWLVLRGLRGLLADQGLGPLHFKWPARSCEELRTELRWFEPTAVSLGFVVLFFDELGVARWSDSIGRTCFVLAMGAMALLLHRLLREGSRLWAIPPKAGSDLLRRTHRAWVVIAVGLPAALAVIALIGYYYTALQLELRVRYSIAIALALLLTNAMLMRWLYVARRRLAVAQALEARARKQEEAKEEAEGPPPVDADKVDIPAVDQGTRQLFRSSTTLAAVVGVFLVWASVFPALQGLDRVQLLPTLTILPADAEWSSAEATATGSSAPQTAPMVSPTPGLGAMQASLPSGTGDTGEGSDFGLPKNLSLDDVLVAIVFLVLTVVATKNVPALLELSVLQRLPVDSGARYAISTIVRYLILLVGVSAISGAIGVGWQEVQWLAAALTFGLAFGLQEIFANFVSGLILLFERPIRVGDVVSVGGVEGRVTELRMRATTIQDKDLRELLVPNKEFITGNVVNWTLSDPVTRLIVSVGIAYGSDTDKARALLLQVAEQAPNVLRDPPPNVIFMRFGESSLDFELRVYIQNREAWPSIIDQLHVAVDAAFRQAGIEIAFPQRDVHLRSMPPAFDAGDSTSSKPGSDPV